MAERERDMGGEVYPVCNILGSGAAFLREYELNDIGVPYARGEPTDAELDAIAAQNGPTTPTIELDQHGERVKVTKHPLD